MREREREREEKLGSKSVNERQSKSESGNVGDSVSEGQ